MNICNHCSKEFEPSKRKDQKYCSKECQNRAANLRRKERAKSEEEETVLSNEELIKQLDETVLTLNENLTRTKKMIQEKEVQETKVSKSVEALKKRIERTKVNRTKGLAEFDEAIVKEQQTIKNLSKFPFLIGAKVATGEQKNTDETGSSFWRTAAGLGAGFIAMKLIPEPYQNSNAQIAGLSKQRQQFSFDMTAKIKKGKVEKQELSKQLEIIQKELQILESKRDEIAQQIEAKEQEREVLIVQELMTKDVLTREERRLINKYRELLQFTGQWLEFIGCPTSPFHIVLYGQAGAGKGFFCVQLAKYLSEIFGKVAYISPEEAGDMTLDIKLDRYEVTEDPTKFITSTSDTLAKIEKIIAEQEPVFVFIDSLTVCGIKDSDLQGLKNRFPKTSFVTIVQTDKSGAIRGSADFEHNCQMVIEVKEGRAYQKKNRFSGWTKTEFSIFEDSES